MSSGKKLTENEARLIAALRALRPNATIAEAQAHLKGSDLAIPHSSAHAAAITLKEKGFIRREISLDGKEVYSASQDGYFAAIHYARRLTRLASMIDQAFADDFALLKISQDRMSKFDAGVSQSRLNEIHKIVLWTIDEIRSRDKAEENRKRMELDATANSSLISKFRSYIGSIFHR